jgi:hypothetical protein
LVRRGIRYKLRGAWDRSETRIGAEDRQVAHGATLVVAAVSTGIIAFSGSVG